MRFNKSVLVFGIFFCVLSSCKKVQDPIFVLNKSEGAVVKFEGLVGSEAGSVAANSVYLDLSTNKTTTSLRSGWDIALAAGNDYKAILNYTTCAGAKVLSKNNLNAITASDTVGLVLSTSQFNPEPFNFTYFDNINGDISQTLIPTLSPVDSLNPVIIINRGTGGGIAARPWIKMRVLRNGLGYTIQYANILDASFKTINVSKNNLYNFQFISFDKAIVNAEPEKLKWDFVWSYGLYQTNFGNGLVPYNFSDLIIINFLAGVQVKEKIYADAAIAGSAFNNFNKDSLAATTLLSGKWTIANNWRVTQPGPTAGAKQDRFYVIKDANGNYYKLKCLAMGSGNDGGTRGKPEFKYAIIP